MSQENSEKPESTEQENIAENEASAEESAETDDVNEIEVEEIDWQAYSGELESKLSAAEQKLEDQKESVLRAKADSENAKRRAEQEVDKARKFALEKFARELLSVVDNLERATLAADAENEAVKSLLEGVELTQKSFLSTFEKFGLEVVDPQGETFDPERHQAMSMQESDDVAPNTVLAVMQKGYLLNGRLLRPAMVMVSRAGTGSSVDTQA